MREGCQGRIAETPCETGRLPTWCVNAELLAEETSLRSIEFVFILIVS